MPPSRADRPIVGSLAARVREMHAAGHSAAAIAEALTLDQSRVAYFIARITPLPECGPLASPRKAASQLRPPCSGRGLNARAIRRLLAEGLDAPAIATRLRLNLNAVIDFTARITPLPGRPPLKKPRTRREQARLLPCAPEPAAPINWWHARPRPGRKYGDWSHPEFEWYQDATDATTAPESAPSPAAIAAATPAVNGWDEPPPGEQWRGRNDVGPSGQPVLLDPVPPPPPPAESPVPPAACNRWERPKGRRAPWQYRDDVGPDERVAIAPPAPVDDQADEDPDLPFVDTSIEWDNVRPVRDPD